MQDLVILENGKPKEERVNGHVYIIEKEDGLIKIGKSSNPNERIKHLSNLGGFKTKRIYITQRCGNPLQVEHQLHKIFKDFNVYGEWFDADFDEILNESNKLIFDPIKYVTKEDEEKSEQDMKELIRMLHPEKTKKIENADEYLRITKGELESVFESVVNKTIDATIEIMYQKFNN